MLASCPQVRGLPYVRIQSKCRDINSPMFNHLISVPLYPPCCLNEQDLRQTDVPDLNILVRPLVEKLDAANLAGDLLWQDLVARDGLDLDISVVRHDCDFWAV